MALDANNMEEFTRIIVSGLPLNITEAQIVAEFKKFGAIQYVRLKKSKASCSCLINFLQKDSGHKARNCFNCQVLFNKRVQISFPDCFPIKDPATNIFVKNIPANSQLGDIESIFLQFGQILNSKIVYDEKGNSLGYGFFMFASAGDVNKVLEKKDQFIVHGKKLEIETFVPKNFRPLNSGNVYVRGFPQAYSKDDLYKKFSEYGKILSHIICLSSGQNFGFVSFEDQKSAEQAVETLDGKLSENILWVVKKSLSKPERIIELKQRKKAVQEKWQRQNLYIKNWPVELNEDQFRSIFERFGKIESLKYVTQECLTMYFSYPVAEVKPTGQVFICYSDEKSADLALYSMRHTLVNGASLSIHKWVPKSYLKKRPENTRKPEKVEKREKFDPKNEPVQYFSIERYTNTKGEDRKRVFGEAIYQEIFCKYENLTGKITGMIIELDEGELLSMMQNKYLLYTKAKEALKILSGTGLKN